MPEPPSSENGTARNARLRCVQARYDAIQADARFDDLRLELEVSGFTGNLSEPGALGRVLTPFSANLSTFVATDDMDRIRWNAALTRMASRYWQRAFGEALLASFPNATISNFGLYQW